MKKLILIFLIILFPVIAWAQQLVEPVEVSRLNPAIVGGSVPAGATTCPAGTYMFAYNGDYTGQADAACFDSGSRNDQAPTVSGTPTITSDYIAIANTTTDYVYWPSSSEDGLNDEIGTLCFSFYIDDEGGGNDGDIDDAGLVSCYASSNNYIRVYAEDGTNNVIGKHRGNAGTAQDVQTAGIVVDAWYRVCYSWNLSTDYHAIVIESGEDAISGWGAAVEANEDMTAFGVAAPGIQVGDNGIDTMADNAWIKDIRVTSGYKDADAIP